MSHLTSPGLFPQLQKGVISGRSPSDRHGRGAPALPRACASELSIMIRTVFPGRPLPRERQDPHHSPRLPSMVRPASYTSSADPLSAITMVLNACLHHDSFGCLSLSKLHEGRFCFRLVYDSIFRAWQSARHRDTR